MSGNGVEAKGMKAGRDALVVDTTEEFVHFFWGELVDLVHASDLSEAAKDDVETVILAILTEALMPAFQNLKAIRSFGGGVSSPNQKKVYEDFSRALWHGYKDLMPKAARLLGFDIDFLFQKESVFKKGVEQFRKSHPMLIAPNLGGYLQRQRSGWQSGLARFRNQFHEDREEDLTKFAAFYEPESAELLFSLVWGVIANVLPVLIEANFRSGLSIEEIPVLQRDPVDRKRYRIVKHGPVKL